MAFLTAAFNGLFIVLQALTGLIGAYQVALSVFGLVARPRHERFAPCKRFVVLVAAHDEECVIAPLLDNLKRMEYPKNLYDVFVIADNCTDRTAEIARLQGAFVAVRRTEGRRGKGHAIHWMLDRLRDSPKRYDAVVLFDADNLVATNFLRAMNERLMSGAKVVQGYLDIKNPYDSWVSISMAISYWYTNRMWQLARHNLGLSCALGGTGLCIDMDVLRRIGWEATGLAEDVEFGARCVSFGIYPVWAHEARVYDEKPVTLRSSMRQRLRWMQGHFHCAQHYMAALLGASLRERSLAKLDAAIYLFQPMRFLILFFTGFMLYFQVTLSHVPLVVPAAELLPTWFWELVNLLVVVQMPLAMFLDKISWKAYLGLPLFPIFMMTWFPVTLVALFTRHNRVWKHTVHTRSIRLDELRTR